MGEAQLDLRAGIKGPYRLRGTRRAIEVCLRETETQIDDAQLQGHDGPEASEELEDLIAIRDAARKCLERLDADDHAGFIFAWLKLQRMISAGEGF